MKIRRYSELLQFDTFEDRWTYLSLRGQVGVQTFGFDRWMNQQFYTSKQWRDLRYHIIARDEGLDLAVPGFEIHDRPIIHHMNPMTPEDLESGSSDVLNPEYLITTSHKTHNAIHYGDVNLLAKPFKPRLPGDTRLW